MNPRFKNVLSAGAALAGLSLIAAAAGCHRATATEASPAPPPPNEAWLPREQLASAEITEGAVESRPLATTIAASGRITFDDLRVAHVFSPVTGRVTRIQAPLGQRVKKGDVLTSIVSPDMGQASSDLMKAEADVIAAEHDLKRKKELFESHAASAADVEASEDNYRRAVAERKRAAEKVKLLHASGDPRVVAQGYPLTSPIDGEVIARMVNPGVEVQGQYGGGGQVNELFTIGELDSVWLLVDVFEMDLPRVRVGSTVIASVVAFPGRAFEGKVDWVSGGIDPSMRTAKVRCVLANTDRALRPEMFATANIAVESGDQPSVPRTAVMHLGTELYLWVESGATPDGKLRLVKTKIEADDSAGASWLALRSGPPLGARIVSSGGIILLGML
jgi:cobalt-zinc-cadmium efflux system membrane fusion protein